MKVLASLLLYLLISSSAISQDKVYYQSEFSKEEFKQRRNSIYEEIGNKSLALIQGARDVDDFNVFRQSNTFYYLSGLETAGSYLLIDGRSKRTTVYLPHRDEGRERGEGKILSVEDADLIMELTGIERVKGVESLSLDLVGAGLIKPPPATLYTPLSPAETGTDSRDMLVNGQARAASDPWDGAPSREAHLVDLITKRFPQFESKTSLPFLMK